MCEWKKGVELSTRLTSCSRTFLEPRNLFLVSSSTLQPWHHHVCTPEQYVCMYTHTCMWTNKLLQRRVDLCCLFNIAQNTTALSHLGKQVIAISIIYSDIQWSRPQTILTSRLTEINVAAHIQAFPPPSTYPSLQTPSISFLQSSPNHLFSSLFYSYFIYFFNFSTKNKNKSLCDFSLTLKAVEH